MHCFFPLFLQSVEGFPDGMTQSDGQYSVFFNPLSQASLSNTTDLLFAISQPLPLSFFPTPNLSNLL